MGDCPGCARDKMAAAIQRIIPPRFTAPVALPGAVTEWAAHGRDAQGLYLTGPVGTGKTHTAWAALTAWCMTTRVVPRIRPEEGPGGWDRPNVIFTRMTDLLDDLRPGDESRQRIRDCQNAALLVIDDVGAEKSSEWTQERFYSIIDHRYAEQVPLILTGNLPPKELAPQVGERAASRLAEMCKVVAMTGEDRRRRPA
jgi:DNA replication protein DnaC